MEEDDPYDFGVEEAIDGNMFQNLKRLETGPEFSSEGSNEEADRNELFADLGTPCLHERVES